MSNLKFILKFILECFGYLLKSITILLSILPNLLKKLTGEVHKRLRFSISFKMTAVYTLIFSTILFLLSIGLIIGFRFFLVNEAKDELTKYSEIAINYAKIDKNLDSLNVDIFSNMKYITLNVFDEKERLVYSTSKDKSNQSFHKDDSPSSVINELDEQLVYITAKLDQNDKIFLLQLSKNLENENEYFGIFAAIIFFINLLA